MLGFSSESVQAIDGQALQTRGYRRSPLQETQRMGENDFSSLYKESTEKK